MQILILCSIVSCFAMPALAIWLLSRMSVIEKGKELEKTGKIDEAIQLYKSAIEENPDDIESKFRLFSLKMKSDHNLAYQIAIELSENTELSKPQLISIHTFLLNHYENIKNTQGLFLSSLKLVFLGAENHEAYLWLARVYGSKGKRDKFEEFIVRAMKGSELDDESTYLYSLHLFSKGDNSGARKLLENIKGEEEIVRKAYYALACYYYVEDPFTASVWLEALNDMTENLELKIFSFILLGICKLKLGEHKSALHNLDAAENFMSNFSKEYLRLFRYAYIWAVHLSGNTSEALAMLKKLSEKDFEFIDIAESYTMGTNDGFKEVEKVVMSRLDEFPRPTILSALSEYGGITYEKIEEIFRKWRLGFKNTSGFKWVISVKDFQELKFQEFIEVSRQLPELFDYRIEKEIPSTQGFSALVVDKTGERSVIDIFPWGSTVSDIAIKELSVVMDENNVSKGIIIVPGQFSKKARTEAGVYNIKLVDKDELQAVMNTK